MKVGLRLYEQRDKRRPTARSLFDHSRAYTIPGQWTLLRTMEDGQFLSKFLMCQTEQAVNFVKLLNIS